MVRPGRVWTCALHAARPTIEQLAEAGRGRCVPHAKLVVKLVKLANVRRPGSWLPVS
jgi:hypothetical protein